MADRFRIFFAHKISRIHNILQMLGKLYISMSKEIMKGQSRQKSKGNHKHPFYNQI